MYSSQLLMLSLLHNNQSSLTNSEWTLLSNVIHSHHTFSTISQVRRNIENLSASSSTVSYDVSNVYETIALMYTSMELFISSAPDFRILTNK
jgi:hypothetical protein